MPKIKPEKIAGIVALSYLALIPVAGLLVYRKIRVMDEDVDTLWANSGLEPNDPVPLVNLAGIKKFFSSR